MNKDKSPSRYPQWHKPFHFETHLSIFECEAQLNRIKREPNLLLGVTTSNAVKSVTITDIPDSDKVAFVLRGDGMMCQGDLMPTAEGGTRIEGVGLILLNRAYFALLLVVLAISVLLIGAMVPLNQFVSFLGGIVFVLLPIVFVFASAFTSRNRTIRFLADLLTGETDRVVSEK